MGNTRLSRLGALVVPLAATTALTVTASPAYAADEIHLQVDSAVSIAAAPDNGAAPATQLIVNLNSKLAKNTRKDVKLTFDATGLSGVAAFATDKNSSAACTTQGQVYTCTISTSGSPFGDYQPSSQQLQPTLTPVKGVALGASGHLKITQTWEGGPAETVDTTVYVGGPSLEFVAEQAPGAVDAGKPGSAVKQVLKVTNKGSVESGQLVLTMDASAGLKLNQHFSNCEYAHRAAGSNDQYSWPDGEAAICTINTSVKPGETVTIDPLEIGVGPEALYPDIEFNVLPNAADGTEWLRKDFHFEPVQSGPRLTAGKPETPGAKPGPPNLGPYTHNAMIVQFRVDNTADLSALGAWAPSDGGKNGVLTVGAHNGGPASVADLRVGDGVAEIFVQLPAGAAAADKLPDGCYASKEHPGRIGCNVGNWLANGTQRTFAIPLTVSDPAAAGKALIDLSSVQGYSEGKVVDLPYDKNGANNTVAVTLGSTANGSVPPGPTAHPTPTNPKPTQAQPSGSPAGNGTAHPSATASATKAGGNLASTGASGIGPMVGGGIAAIALGGGVIFLVARRRKAGAHQ